MPPHITIRPIQPTDFAAWKPLWDGYNAFYGREGATSLPDEITKATWQRFLSSGEPVHALLASLQTPEGEQVVGLMHYIFHRSTTRLHDVCYLQDLYTAPAHRGKRIGAQLIEAVYTAAKQAGSSRVYWTTQTTNTSGRPSTTNSPSMRDLLCNRMSFRRLFPSTRPTDTMRNNPQTQPPRHL